MRKYFQNVIMELCYYLELFVSLTLVAAIMILSWRLLISVMDLRTNMADDALNLYIGKAMSLAIGVELVKMLSKHTPVTVVEVLLFAIARQMVAEHDSAINTLLGVAAIAGLFATRKYLFSVYDATDRTLYRASMPTKLVNSIEKIHIPEEEGKTLKEVVLNRLEQEEGTIAVGACVYYKKFALRVAKISNNQITRIEVIRTI